MATNSQLTKGRLVGDIIDAFSIISEQVKFRCDLGLTDLTILAESFFRDVLNVLLSINLENLNETRINEPGLDLGDEESGWGFQVTASRTSAKVNQTLQALTEDQKEKYKKVFILIIGQKQTQYKLDQSLADPIKFTSNHIWDMRTLGRKVISLPVDKLYTLYQLVQTNIGNLQSDLEISNETGKYSTNSYDRWESRAVPMIGNGLTFIIFSSEKTGMHPGYFYEAGIREAIREAAHKLARLPRITREFFAMLYERREQQPTQWSRNGMYATVLLGKVEREYQHEDFQGELELLEHAGFLSLYADDSYCLAEIVLHISRTEDFAVRFTQFVEECGLSYKRIIGEVDFSYF